MMMGLSPDTHPRELVKIGRTITEGRVPPRIVKEGPCKENIVTARTSISMSFRCRNGTGSMAAVICSPTAAS